MRQDLRSENGLVRLVPFDDVTQAYSHSFIWWPRPIRVGHLDWKRMTVVAANGLKATLSTMLPVKYKL